MFTHVTRDEMEGQNRLHISRLHHYVSAYETNKEMVNDLVEDIEAALEKAKETHESIIVDQDGVMCFHVYPSGTIALMLPWKRFKIVREEGDT